MERPSLPNQHAWINGSGRMSYVPSNSTLQLGPGQYTDAESRVEVRNSSWGKCERFTDRKGFSNRLGPGQYNSKNELKHITAPISVFKSKGPRTFIQEMIQKNTKQNNKIRNP